MNRSNTSSNKTQSQNTIEIALQKMLENRDFEEIVALVHTDIRIIFPVVRFMLQGQGNTCIAAALALGKIGLPALPFLVSALTENPNYIVRHAASMGLSEVADHASISALIQALNDPHYTVRQGAAYTLGQIGDPQAIDALTRLLYDPHQYPREMAAVALGEIGDAKAIDALERVVRESVDQDMQRKAQEALAKIKAKG
ncbi:MAG: HEAT repeat domain-containing protein [Anaerolineae bacterium]|nr:HEAT repeat domain-containing protein [Anaerolineae bacterium]